MSRALHRVVALLLFTGVLSACGSVARSPDSLLGVVDADQAALRKAIGEVKAQAAGSVPFGIDVDSCRPGVWRDEIKRVDAKEWKSVFPVYIAYLGVAEPKQLPGGSWDCVPLWLVIFHGQPDGSFRAEVIDREAHRDRSDFYLLRDLRDR